MKRIKPRSTPPAERFPKVNQGRRRFLAQLGTASCGVGLLGSLGLPKLAHGQSVEFNLGLLNEHPTHAEVHSHVLQAALGENGDGESMAPDATEMMASAARTADAAAGLGQAEGASPTLPAAQGDSGTEPAQAEPGDNDAADERLAVNPDWVTEDRALWIEPGYMVLARLTRPPDDLSVVERFEGSTAEIEAYLGENASGFENMHDLLLLHQHEVQITGIITPRIAPAVIDVLHLDHDCAAVCSGVDVGIDAVPITAGGVRAPTY